LRNRAVFRRRWEHVLASRPLSPLHASRRRILAARDAPATSRILMVVDTSDPPLTQPVEALAPWAASARVTVLAVGEGDPPSLDPQIELVERSNGIEEWLADRRFHYDVVIAAQDEWFEPLLGRTQPTAVRILTEAVWTESLADAGVAPPSHQARSPE
jgi:hypothetical protein